MLTRRGVGVRRSKFSRPLVGGLFTRRNGFRVLDVSVKAGRRRGFGFLCYVLNLGPRAERVCSRMMCFVSGLKLTPPACRGRLCSSSPWAPAKSERKPTGVAFSGPESPAAACPKSMHSVPKFQECVSRTRAKARGKLLGWG
jgi:hypothetical protein